MRETLTGLYLVLLLMGFANDFCYQKSGALLPHLFTLTF